MEQLTKEQQVQLKKELEKIVESLERIAPEKDLIKDCRKVIKEKFKLKPKIINRLAKTMYMQTFDEDVATDEEFASLFLAIAGNKKDE
jgi:hypothetical protein